MHKKFEINRTKIKGGCQLRRKVVTHNSKSDLLLVKIRKNYQRIKTIKKIEWASILWFSMIIFCCPAPPKVCQSNISWIFTKNSESASHMTMEKRNLNRAPGFKFQVFPSIYQCKTQQDAHYNFSSPWLCSTMYILWWWIWLRPSLAKFPDEFLHKLLLTNSHYIQGYFRIILLVEKSLYFCRNKKNFIQKKHCILKHINCMNNPLRHKKLIKNLTNNWYLSNGSS